ncbi:putative methyltransferase-domain-containing protein [Phyllosticta capitalensis]|uniref:Methyltransferase-domain-containing protein n=1 Tax=Phyllosticta capitalensis TaxID=121624 RepID=A0ABR1YZV9_9PEZI
MRYIRFLKVPRADSKSISCVVTITSDLGEDFLAEDVALSATVRGPQDCGDIFLRKSLKWTAGMRALPVKFDLRHCDLDWPVVVHVGQKDQLADYFETHLTGSELPAVISVTSAPLNVPAGICEAERKVHRRLVPLSNRPLKIWEETGESIARHIWDAGVGLAAFFDKIIALQYESLPLLDSTLSSATYRKLNVLELGCGCGIVGISLAQLVPDCHVWMTDLPEAQEIAQKNIDAMNPAMASTVKFETLDWDRPLPKPIENQVYDMIVASDCTYNPDTSPALVKTLQALVARSPKAIVVLAMKSRHESEGIFFELMERAGFMTATTARQPLPREETDYHSATKVDIFIFHYKTRPKTADQPFFMVDGSVEFWQSSAAEQCFQGTV